MPNVPLREGIVAVLDKKRREKSERTGVHTTYSDVILGLLEKDK